MLLVKRIWLPSSRDSLGICCVARDESAGVRQRIEAARIVNERTRSRDCMLIHGLFSVREIADYRRAMRDRHHAVSEFERASIVLNMQPSQFIIFGTYIQKKQLDIHHLNSSSRSSTIYLQHYTHIFTVHGTPPSQMLLSLLSFSSLFILYLHHPMREQLQPHFLPQY